MQVQGLQGARKQLNVKREDGAGESRVGDGGPPRIGRERNGEKEKGNAGV